MNSATDYFWIYYGNSAAAFDNHYSSKDVWNTNYVGVWHLNQTSGNMKDATINMNNANETTATTGQQGKLDGTCQFNGLTDYVLIPDSPSLDGMNSITVEFWAYQTTHHVNRMVKTNICGHGNKSVHGANLQRRRARGGNRSFLKPKLSEQR